MAKKPVETWATTTTTWYPSVETWTVTVEGRSAANKPPEIVLGITSLTTEGKHILMWDFDERSKEVVETSLLKVQAKYNLPSIVLVRSRYDELHWHGYCFVAGDQSLLFKIIDNTLGIDPSFVALTKRYGFATLRVTSKQLELLSVEKVLAASGAPSYGRVTVSDLAYLKAYPVGEDGKGLYREGGNSATRFPTTKLTEAMDFLYDLQQAVEEVK